MTVPLTTQIAAPMPVLSCSSNANISNTCKSTGNRKRSTGTAANSDFALTVESISEIAKRRYLKVAELEYLLNPSTTPLPILTKPACNRPASGSLYLFDRNVTLTYKEDGHFWIRRRNSTKVREDHVKLRRKGDYRVAGIYSHAMNPTTLHRRSYHLLDKSTGMTKTPVVLTQGGEVVKEPSLVLVHYLDTVVAARLNNVSGETKVAKEKKRRVETEHVPKKKKVKVEEVIPTFYPDKLEVEDPQLISAWGGQLKSYWNTQPTITQSMHKMSTSHQLSMDCYDSIWNEVQKTDAHVNAVVESTYDKPSVVSLEKPQADVVTSMVSHKHSHSASTVLDSLWDMIMNDDCADVSVYGNTVPNASLDNLLSDDILGDMDTLFD